MGSTGRDWNEKLPLILIAVQGTKTIHGYSVHMVITGKKMQLPEAFWLDLQAPSDLDTVIVNNLKISNLLKEIQSIH